MPNLTLVAELGDRSPCQGYASGCLCAACRRRSQGLAAGELRCDGRGSLQAVARRIRQPWEPAPLRSWAA